MQNEIFGRYVLLERLGYGGMAEVFLARAGSIAGFEKYLAIKRLLPYCIEDQQTVDLLADEAKITVRLTHPNIVQVFDFGTINGQYYIAMEYIDGLDLKSLIRIDDNSSKQLPIDVALYITISILDALDFAHKQVNTDGTPLGIIHRDATPHNVLISRMGLVKLSDFGVARAAISSHVSIVGDIRGKYSYMPPEQVFGAAIDQRIDIFATGAILYELLTGRQPYRASSAAEQIHQLSEGVAPPSKRKPQLPTSLDEITLKALEKDPQRRFSTAEEFASKLRNVLIEECKTDTVPPAKKLSLLVLSAIGEYSKIKNDVGLMSQEQYHSDQTSLISEALASAKREPLSSHLKSTVNHNPKSLLDQVTASGPALAAAPQNILSDDEYLPFQDTAIADQEQTEISTPSNLTGMPTETAEDPLDIAETALMEPLRPSTSEVATVVTPFRSLRSNSDQAKNQSVEQSIVPVDIDPIKTTENLGENPLYTARTKIFEPGEKKHKEISATESKAAYSHKIYPIRVMAWIIGACIIILAAAFGAWLAGNGEETIVAPPSKEKTESSTKPTTFYKDKIDPLLKSSTKPISTTLIEPESVTKKSEPPLQASPKQLSPIKRQHGYLSVNATPWGTVYIDGKLVAKETPLLQYRISPGTHRIQIYHVAIKRRSETRIINILPGKSNTVLFKAP